MNAIDKDQVLSSHNVAYLLQVHVTSVNTWAAKGLLLCYRTPGKHRRFKVGDVLAFAARQSMPIAVSRLTEMISPTTYNITAAGRAALAERNQQ